eukprot:sb/3471967/
MDKPDFLHLVTLLENRNKAVTNGLCQREKLFLTLSWLRSGVSFSYHGAVFKVSDDSVRRIIREGYRYAIHEPSRIFQTLGDLKSILSTGVYDCRPKNKKDWVDVAKRDNIFESLPSAMPSLSKDDVPDLDNSAPQDSGSEVSAPIPQAPSSRLKEGQAVRNNLRQFFTITVTKN